MQEALALPFLSFSLLLPIFFFTLPSPPLPHSPLLFPLKPPSPLPNFLSFPLRPSPILSRLDRVGWGCRLHITSASWRHVLCDQDGHVVALYAPPGLLVLDVKRLRALRLVVLCRYFSSVHLSEEWVKKGGREIRGCLCPTSTSSRAWKKEGGGEVSY